MSKIAKILWLSFKYRRFSPFRHCTRRPKPRHLGRLQEPQVIGIQWRFSGLRSPAATGDAASPLAAPTSAAAAAIKVSQLQRRQLHLAGVRQLRILGFHEPRRNPRLGWPRKADTAPGRRAWA